MHNLAQLVTIFYACGFVSSISTGSQISYNMEDILRKLPSPIYTQGKVYHLSITKLRDKYLVSYDSAADTQQLFWRFNERLSVALRMMLTAAIERKLYSEDHIPDTFKQLPDYEG